MAVDLQQYAADDAAFVKQAADARNAKQTQESLQGSQQQEPSFVSKFMTSVGRATADTLDWAVSSADSINTMRDRAAHDVGAGVMTGATNIADAAGSAISSSGRGLAAAEDPANADVAKEGSLPMSPIWDHAKSSILDFRDAMAVKDPTFSDTLLQSAAQLAVPFTGYSRMLSGVHGLANIALAGGLADATALGPHDARMADVMALGRHTEGKFGETLRALAPDGSAVHAYINYLADRGGPDLSAYKLTPGNPSADPANWDKRADGSSKGQGFLGLLQRPDGRVSSELSIGVELNGQETEIPMLVPTLSKEEVDYLMTHEPDPQNIPASIRDKAVAFASKRLAANKSPFAGQGEQVNPETEAEGRFKNVLDGFGTNMVVTPLLATVGTVLKQGTAGLRYAIDNGVGSVGELMPANQKGMVAFHGTRADIPPEDGFNNDKLLTGEGTNAFGAGHYFAENPATAGTYARRNLERVHPELQSAASDVESAGSKQKAIKKLNAAADSTDNPAEAMFLRRKAQLIKSGAVDKASGNLYSVDIPDEHIAKMVDWDAPLSEQPETVRETFAAHGINEANMTGGDAYKLLSSKLDRALGGTDEAYQRGSGGDRAASALLHMRGVPGIHFLDAGSRAAGTGTRNLVLFNGKDAKILGKNGKSFTGQEPTNMSMSKEERAAERERVAALRDREVGGGREFEPEPIPARAAEHEGVVARRRKGD